MSDAFDQLRQRNLENLPLRRGCFTLAIPIVAVIVAGLIINALFVERVPYNEACAVTSFGAVQKNADGSKQWVGPGLHFMSPDKQLVCFKTQRITMELVEGEPSRSNSRADYVDYAIKGRTKDGIDLYSMLTMQYHVPEECAGALLPTVINDEGVKEQIVKARLRSIVPQKLSSYDAITQYRGNISAISDDIQTQLAQELKDQCVTLDLFELKRGDFDDAYENSIRARAQEIETAEKKKLEQNTATEEAKRLAIETEAAAAKRKVEADAAAYVERTETDAAVYDLEQRAAALRENPSLIEWEKVQALRDAGAVYLPSDVLPVMPLPAITPQPGN